ncbi:hypothetical protein M3Y98_00262300 [Aphelenchoides besseyi]|nr:hypothetical protein M3Y98_00262300 [Aphelenchoides besseyi]
MHTAFSSGYHSMAPTAESNLTMSNFHLQPAPQIQIVSRTQWPTSQATAEPNTSQRLIAMPRHRSQLNGTKRHSNYNMHQQVLRSQQIAACEEREMNNQMIASSSNQKNSSGMSYWNTEQWMQDHRFSVPTRSSRSVLSGKRSIVSGVSDVSRFSQLSINTNLSIHTDMDGMSVQTLQDNNKSSNSNYVQPPLLDERRLNEILDAIEGKKKLDSDGEPTMQDRNWTLHYLYKQLRDRPYLTFAVDAQVKIVYVLIRFSYETEGQISGVVWHCVAIIQKITTSDHIYPKLLEEIFTKTPIYNFVMSCLTYQHSSCFDMATFILYKLLSNSRINLKRIQNTEKEKMLVLLMNVSNTKFKKSIIWECIHHLVRSSSIMDYFIQANGIDFCIQSLNSDVEETVLVPVVRVITKFTNYNDRAKSVKCTNVFMEMHGVDSLSNWLDHGSPRLLIEITEVLRNIGCLVKALDLKTHGKRSLIVAMQRTIQLFGSSDLVLIDYITGFLCNITTGDFAKCALANPNSINSLLKMMEIVCTNLCNSDTHTIQLLEVMDNLLLCLANIVTIQDACVFLYTIPSILSLFLEMLELFAINHSFLCVHRIVRIVNTILRTCPQAVATFHLVYDRRRNLNYVPTVVNIFGYLIELRAKDEEKKKSWRLLQVP